MEDVLDGKQEEDIQLTDKDVFTKIWTSPRKVFKFINDNEYDNHVTVLLILSGISKAFDQASLKNMGDRMSIWPLVGICIVAGGFFGFIFYYIYAAMVVWTGRWLKGQGDLSSILRIWAYGMLPSVLALVLLVPQLAIYGSEIFKSEGDIVGAGWLSNILFYGSLVLEFILGLCSLVFCVIGISEVQKLSIGKSILNFLLPGLIIVLSMVFLVFMIRVLH